MRQLIDELEQLFLRRGTFTRLRQGVVDTVHAGPPKTLDVKVGGNTTAVPSLRYLASYTAPAPGDVVMILQAGPDMFVLGPRA